MKKKIFVAGGTGFLGQRVIKKLKEKKIPFVTTSLSQGVDFRQFEPTLAFFKKHRPQIVIHCAAYIGGIKFGLDHAAEMYYNNILMTTYLIEAARKIKVEKFISPLANCIYPNVINKDFEENELWNGPLNQSVLAYGMVRKAHLAQTWAYQHQYGMNFVNLILPNMYGPGDYFDAQRSHALGALLMRITEAKEKNELELVVWGTGKPIRDWLYVDDGAEALVRAIDIDYPIEPINIGSGRGISIKDLAQLIKRIVGYRGRLVFDPGQPDGAPYKVMNVARCKKIFKWQPKTSLKEGIIKTYRWYLLHHRKK